MSEPKYRRTGPVLSPTGIHCLLCKKDVPGVLSYAEIDALHRERGINGAMPLIEESLKDTFDSHMIEAHPLPEPEIFSMVF
jgi:hypothetical protein